MNRVSPLLYHSLVRPKWATKKYIHRLIEQHGTFDGKMTLDFGSGTGANCILCNPSHYLGIDPDEKRIQLARRLYPRHRFEVFDGKEIPLEDQSVDQILIIAVLHHIPDQALQSYIQQFRRILRPSGSILVMEPCFFSQYPISSRVMRWMDDGQYIRSEAEYLQLFAQNRFQCEVYKRFRKGLFYHEIFFCARP